MSMDKDKDRSRKRCNACDFEKLKQLENNPVIRKLRDKIEQLSFRLTECRNENQMLKRNLQLAKKMVCQEVGGNQEINFQALMKYGTEPGSKNRQEHVIVLKTKLHELKEYLKELEGEAPTPQETPSEEYVRCQMPSDRKKLWRMELERRLARENVEKDINPLVQECFELRRNLDTEKNRFRELSDELKLLRGELQSQVEKNEEDFGIVKSFKTLERQLEETIAERAEIRFELDGSRTRNKRLTEEINSLKDELEVWQKKTNDNNHLIDSLTLSHKNIQEAIDSEKVIVQQNIERYEKEMKELQQNQSTDFEIMEHLQCIVFDRNALIDELERDLDAEAKKEEKKKETPEVRQLPPKESKIVEYIGSRSKVLEEESSVSEDQESEHKPTEAEIKVRKLRLECAKYKALCEAAKMEGDRLSLLIANQDKKMNEVAVQVVETGRLIMQKNQEKKELFEKVNKLQRSLSAKRRRGKLHGYQKNRIEELRIKNEAQKEENDFLRNFLRSAVCCKAKELEQFKGFIIDSRHFFDACLKEITELLESEPSALQNDDLVTEPIEELHDVHDVHDE